MTDALERANEIRLRRAALRRWVGEVPGAESLRRAREVLAAREDAVRTLPLGEFLLWPTRWGTTKARRTAAFCRLGENKPLGALTERQVGVLDRALRAPRGPRGRDAT